MTEPTTPAEVLDGTPPPVIEPDPPTEHVVEPAKPKGRVFTAAPVNPVTDQIGEDAPDTVATIDEQPKAAEVAVREQAGPLAVAEQEWPHDFMDFEGDRLEIRLPDDGR